MKTETYDVRTSSGRTVGVWRSTTLDPVASEGPVVVVAPGFGQRIRSAGALSLMLVRNGATVYRFDSLDHVGLSDGQIRDFCIASLYESLAAVVAQVGEREQRERVTLLATSLAALPGLQYAAKEGRVDRMVMMLGVVSGRNTLRSVLKHDYLADDLDTLPDSVIIDKHEVDPGPIWRESRIVDWWDEPSTINALINCDIPVCNYVAVDDDWVDIDDVRRVFDSARRPDPAETVEINLSGHALLRNPVALKAMMTDVARRLTGVGADADVVTPSFEDMVELRGAERDLERLHTAGRGAP